MSRNTALALIVGLGCAALACAALVCLVAAGVLGFALSRAEATPTPAPPLPLGTPEPAGLDMRLALERTELPIRDLPDLARRLQGVEDVPPVVAESAEPIPVGTTRSFFVSNVDTDENRSIRATLRYATPHVYFWAEDGAEVDEGDLRDLIERFERQTYPTTREFFGSEWTPGVDGDPHLYILYARDLGSSLAGYYSSVDEYPAAIHEYSNQHEMFYLNADNLDLGSDETGSTLTHEFQHMIHWANDLNEDSWVNEGFSEVAAFLDGYGASSFAQSYLADPDRQLNAWPGPDGDTNPHYGAAFLFLSYFLERFGDEATQSLVANPENGLDSVDEVLARLDATDPTTGQPLTADDLFADWTAANVLDDPSAASGEYAYPGLDSFSTASVQESVDGCPSGRRRGSVHQYGADYIRITCRGPITLRLAGLPEVRVVPTEFPNGRYAFWSNRGDESDMTLTREFDFSSVAGPLTLTYSIWFDIEENYDYVYLEASTDGAEHWTIRSTPSGTDYDPTGANYGWGYTAASGGWIEERVDLSDFAGMPRVLLRFEYVTDASVNTSGFLLDDVRLPAIGYAEGFEAGEGGWQPAGFVRLSNRLPQTFRVQVIERGPGGTRVIPMALDERNSGEHRTTLDGEVDEVILVVSGTTRFTQETAEYEYLVESLVIGNW